MSHSQPSLVSMHLYICKNYQRPPKSLVSESCIFSYVLCLKLKLGNIKKILIFFK